MSGALSMEDSQHFHEAMLEYVYVARNFPATRFYKTAIFKAAMLSGRPDNPKRNLNTSLYWLHQYLNLPLSDQEQEAVKFLIALLEQNKKYQDEVVKLQIVSQNQRDVISQNDSKIAVCEKQGEKRKGQIRQLQKKNAFYEKQIDKQDKQILQLQAEISKTQDALQRLKEIDMRIHQRRLK